MATQVSGLLEESGVESAVAGLEIPATALLLLDALFLVVNSAPVVDGDCGRVSISIR
ncbi:MAG: hypothetical protein IT428_12725 [Planctomycetaceae bacterium]|nr:hypothetical protein [Planctomycetaceae bacterium]